MFFEIFYFQFRFLAILHQQKEKAPTYLPTYQLRGSIGPWYPVPFATLEEEAGLGERRRRGRRRKAPQRRRAIVHVSRVIGLQDRLLHGCDCFCELCSCSCFSGMWENGIPRSIELVQSPRGLELGEGNKIPATGFRALLWPGIEENNCEPDLCQAAGIVLISCKTCCLARAASFYPVEEDEQLAELESHQQACCRIPGLYGRGLRLRGSFSARVS